MAESIQYKSNGLLLHGHSKVQKGCPARVSVDIGTENGHVCQIQRAM